MIVAKKLENNQTILDVVAGEVYIALYRQGELILNNLIRMAWRYQLPEGKQVPVKVTKVQLPDKIFVDVINEEFTIIGAKDADTTEKGKAPAKGPPAQETAASARPAGKDLKRSESAIPEPTIGRPAGGKGFFDPRLDAMRHEFENIAALIKEAVSSRTPIILRHHSDCDGYAGGIALEKAIAPLLKKELGDYAYKYYTRVPSRTPYYDYSDATRDMEMALTSAKRREGKPPLVILVDLGSGQENLLTIKMVKGLGGRLIVIDHHTPGKKDGKSESLGLLDAHINPFLFGSDSRFCAGILAFELARIINPEAKGLALIPAVAAVADKAEKYERAILDHYLAIAEKEGYSRALVERIAEVVDYEANAAKFFDIGNIIDALFGNDKRIQKALLDILIPLMDEIREEFSGVIEKYARAEDHGSFAIVVIDADACTFRGEFPPMGKLVGMAHERVLSSMAGRGVITVGRAQGMLIFRADGAPWFDVNTLIALVRKEVPYSLAEGGGHAAAGSMTFLAAAQEEVYAAVMSALREGRSRPSDA